MIFHMVFDGNHMKIIKTRN